MNPATRPSARPGLSLATVLAVLSAVIAALAVLAVQGSGPGAPGAGTAAAREVSLDAHVNPGAATPVQGSMVGSYLAARHAQVHHDFPAAANFLVRALERAPDEPSLRRSVHTALLLDGRFDEAVRVAADVAAADDRAQLARLTLAVAAIRDGRLDAADAELQAMAPDSLYRVLKPLLRAWTLFGAGRFDEAMEVLDRLRASSQATALYNMHAALLRAAHGNPAAAEMDFKAVLLEEDDPSLRAIDLYGQFLERLGRTGAALELYRDYLADGSRSAVLEAAAARAERGEAPPPAIDSAAAGAAEALFTVAGALSQQPAPETALLIARHALVLRPDFPALQALTGSLLEALDRLEDANAIYAEIDPASPLTWQLRLRTAANLDELGETAAAEAMLLGMAAERPDNYEPLVDLGDVMRRHERFGEAVDAYDAAVARIPKPEQHHWSVFYARGIALERSKLWDRAEADFMKALAFEPDQPLVLNYLGYSWIDMGRNLEQALDMVRRAVDQRPNDGYIVDSLGWAYYRLGRHEDAVRELERAVEIRPEDPVINDHLGDAYWQVGREREARFQWTAALGLDPDPEVRAAIEEKLANGLIRQARAVPEEGSGPPVAD